MMHSLRGVQYWIICDQVTPTGVAIQLLPGEWFVDDTHGAYRRENDSYLIEIDLSDPRQMFNSLDPAPFIEKDLDDDAEAYIVAAVREFHLTTPLKLVLHLPQAQRNPVADSLPDAVHNYFAYRAQVTRRRVVFALRRGRHMLLLGLVALFVFLGLSELIGSFGDGHVLRILKEGAIIGGWVAMWRPTEQLLYDWWPLRWERLLLQKLAEMPVEVRYR